MTPNTVTIVSAFSGAESLPSKQVFLAAPNQEVTYATLCDRIRRFSACLAEVGVKPGDRVVFSTKDDLLAATIFLGLVRTGVTAVFLDPETKPFRAKSLLRFIEPKALLLDEDLASLWRGDSDSPLIPIRKSKTASLISRLLGRSRPDDSLEGRLEQVKPASLPEEIDPQSLAYILFTSGTTDHPKGVCITHGALNAHLATLGKVYSLSGESRILNPLPLSHADGMIQGPVLAFFQNACWCRPFRFQIQRIEEFLDVAYRERVTHIVVVPTILSMLNRFAGVANDSFRHEEFRFVISCGATLESNVWTTFERLFGVSVINGYGLTETIAGGLFAGHEPGEDHHGTIGKPVDCQIRIVGESGKDVLPGEKGELLIHGPLLMQGYFRAPEETSEALVDGWLRTGDIARVNSAGLIEIAGRKKNIIISGGLNIHPEEIDQVLQKFPGVLEAATISKEDEMWGELAISAVVMDAPSTPSENALMEHCRRHLEETKVPAEVHFLESLPRGRSGKVNGSELRSTISSLRRPATPADPSKNSECQLLAIAAECFKIPPGQLTLRSSAETIPEWNSLAHLTLVAEVEKAFCVQFSPTDVIRIKTLGDVFAVLQRRVPLSDK